MPELPEVETTVRAINKFENSTLKEVIVHNKNLRWKVDKKVESFTKNKLIHKISRRAKYILIYLDEYCLMIHLGMSGKLRIQNNCRITHFLGQNSGSSIKRVRASLDYFITCFEIKFVIHLFKPGLYPS